MTKAIDLMKNHCSNRNFVKGHKMMGEELNEILLAMKQAPSWMNGQQYSVIVIDDQEIKDKLFTLSTRNKHIETSSVFFLFLADLTKQKAATDLYELGFEIENDMDVMINITTDTVLAMQNTATAAESLGYGTVFCGGIRMAAKELIEMFDLPKNVFPVCGLSVGKVDETIPVEKIKPRFPMEVNVGRNSYPRVTPEQVKDYDKELEIFAEARETKLWSKKFADIYSVKTTSKTNELLKKQGF